MLVLSRRINEKICISSLGITICVVQVNSGVVRLGIYAPAEVKIVRVELLDSVASVAAVAGAPRG